MNPYLAAIGGWAGRVIDAKLIVTVVFGGMAYHLGQSGRLDQAGVLTVFGALIALWGVGAAGAAIAGSPTLKRFLKE